MTPEEYQRLNPFLNQSNLSTFGFQDGTLPSQMTGQALPSQEWNQSQNQPSNNPLALSPNNGLHPNTVGRQTLRSEMQTIPTQAPQGDNGEGGVNASKAIGIASAISDAVPDLNMGALWEGISGFTNITKNLDQAGRKAKANRQQHLYDAVQPYSPWGMSSSMLAQEGMNINTDPFTRTLYNSNNYFNTLPPPVQNPNMIPPTQLSPYQAAMVEPTRKMYEQSQKRVDEAELARIKTNYPGNTLGGKATDKDYALWWKNLSPEQKALQAQDPSFPLDKIQNVYDYTYGDLPAHLRATASGYGALDAINPINWVGQGMADIIEGGRNTPEHPLSGLSQAALGALAFIPTEQIGLKGAKILRNSLRESTVNAIEKQAGKKLSKLTGEEFQKYLPTISERVDNSITSELNSGSRKIKNLLRNNPSFTTEAQKAQAIAKLSRGYSKGYKQELASAKEELAKATQAGEKEAIEKATNNLKELESSPKFTKKSKYAKGSNRLYNKITGGTPQEQVKATQKVLGIKNTPLWKSTLPLTIPATGWGIYGLMSAGQNQRENTIENTPIMNNTDTTTNPMEYSYQQGGNVHTLYNAIYNNPDYNDFQKQYFFDYYKHNPHAIPKGYQLGGPQVVQEPQPYTPPPTTAQVPLGETQPKMEYDTFDSPQAPRNPQQDFLSMDQYASNAPITRTDTTYRRQGGVAWMGDMNQPINHKKFSQASHYGSPSYPANYGGYAQGGDIHINPENKGKFTEWAQSHGFSSVQEAASHVMANKDDYSTHVVQMANFAKNAKKFNHAQEGASIPQGNNVQYLTEAQIASLEAQGYKVNRLNG